RRRVADFTGGGDVRRTNPRFPYATPPGIAPPGRGMRVEPRRPGDRPVQRIGDDRRGVYRVGSPLSGRRAVGGLRREGPTSPVRGDSRPVQLTRRRPVVI